MSILSMREKMKAMIRDLADEAIYGVGHRDVSPIPPLRELNWHARRRLEFFRDAAGYLSTNRLGGVYAEFGCHTATTFRFALNTVGHPVLMTNPLSRFYAFDSFRGLPEPTESDRHSAWAAGKLATSLEQFKAACRRDLHRIEIVPGFFSESLPALTWPAGQRIAMAYIDSDLYSSARDVLSFLTGKLAHGAILAFDDYNCFYADPQRGERRALTEWLQTVPGTALEPFLPFGWFGMSYVVHEKALRGMEG